MKRRNIFIGSSIALLALCAASAGFWRLSVVRGTVVVWESEQGPARELFLHEGQIVFDYHDAADPRGFVGVRKWSELGFSHILIGQGATCAARTRIPFWAIVLCFAVGAASCDQLRGRRTCLGCCSVCGYDLRVSVGLCPECGTEIGAPQTAEKDGSN